MTHNVPVYCFFKPVSTELRKIGAQLEPGVRNVSLEYWKVPTAYDVEQYKLRQKVERFFGRLE